MFLRVGELTLCLLSSNTNKAQTNSKKRICTNNFKILRQKLKNKFNGFLGKGMQHEQACTNCETQLSCQVSLRDAHDVYVALCPVCNLHIHLYPPLHMNANSGDFCNLPLSKASVIPADAGTGTKESGNVPVQVDARGAFFRHEIKGVEGIEIQPRLGAKEIKEKRTEEVEGIVAPAKQNGKAISHQNKSFPTDSDRGKKITFPCCRFTFYENRINDAVSHLESENACFLCMVNKAARLKKPQHLFCKLVQMTECRIAARAKGCMCTFRTKCLRRYCECFGNGIYCSDKCKCGDACHNDGKHETEREEAIRHVKIETKMHGKNFNSTAFFFGNDSFADNNVNSCRCRNSRCTRKYCSCFAIGLPCNNTCVCEGCDNR